MNRFLFFSLSFFPYFSFSLFIHMLELVALVTSSPVDESEIVAREREATRPPVSILLSDFKSIIRGLPPRPVLWWQRRKRIPLWFGDAFKIRGHIRKAKGEKWIIKERDIHLLSNWCNVRIIKYIHSVIFFILFFSLVSICLQNIRNMYVEEKQK